MTEFTESYIKTIETLQDMTLQPESLERMAKACQSLTATLNQVAGTSLFDTEPELLQATLDELSHE